MLFPEAIILSLIVAKIRGGSIRRLGDIDLRHTWMIFAIFFLTACLFLKHVHGLEFISNLALGVLLVVYASTLLFVFMNRHLRGMAVLGVGAALNFACMAANGGKMPVSYEAVKRVHMEKAFSTDMARHNLLGKDTKLPLLADIIPRAWPPFPERDVMSFGDTIVALGLFLVVQSQTRKRRPKAKGQAEEPA
jgi:hypothetical protein